MLSCRVVVVFKFTKITGYSEWPGYYIDIHTPANGRLGADDTGPRVGAITREERSAGRQWGVRFYSEDFPEYFDSLAEAKGYAERKASLVLMRSFEGRRVY